MTKFHGPSRHTHAVPVLMKSSSLTSTRLPAGALADAE
jgi:hypothetical protein